MNPFDQDDVAPNDGDDWGAHGGASDGYPVGDCGHSAAVLACHLDGEPAEDLPGGPLDEHLRGCAACQQALRRARRLDAALAQASGQAIAQQLDHAGGAALTERWFAAVAAGGPPIATARVPAMQHQRGGHRTGWPRLAAAALVAAMLLAATLVVGAVSRMRDPEPAMRGLTENPTVGPMVATASAFPAAVDPAAVGPAAVDPTAANTAVAAPTTMIVTAADPVVDLAALQHWRSQTGPRANRPEPTVAPLRPHSNPNTALAAQLQRRANGGSLDDGDRSTLRAATLRGNRELDAALRRVARRHPEGLAIVADALRLGGRTSGCGRLLLELWEDGSVRGQLADDENAAAQLFRGQAPATFTEVATELRRCSQAAQRRRCLLALGFADDAGVLPELCAHLQSARQEDAMVAAFALSCLPGALLAALVADATPPGAPPPDTALWRAALLRSDARELQPWRTQMAISAELRASLAGASLAQFLELAPRLRHTADVAE